MPPALPPPPPAQEERRHAIDFMGPGSSVQNHRVDFEESYDETSARHLDYVTRRWELSLREPTYQAVSHRSHAVQVAFRLKMLTIFALQLMVVALVVTAFRFQAKAKRVADDFFTPPPAARLAITFGVALVLLVTMYLVRNVFLLNWVMLLLFTCAQCVFFVGLGVAWNSDMCVYHCAFTVACVVIMTALSCVRRKSESSAYSDTGERNNVLLSTFWAGIIAYLLVAMGASALFVVYGRDLVTNQGFGYALGIQFLLSFRFAYDASAMYKVVSPDECQHGVIYLYTGLFMPVVFVVHAMYTTAINGEGDCYYKESRYGDCQCCKWPTETKTKEAQQQQPQLEPVTGNTMYRV